MSFILDALRKSEHARERRALPGLIELASVRAPRSRLPWALAAVALLLVVNMGVLLYVLARPASGPTAAAGAARATTPAIATIAAAPPPADARPAPPPLVRPLAREAAPADPAFEVPEPPLAARPAYAPTPAAPVKPAADAAAGLPTIRELPTAVAGALPPLHLDLHVFSADRAQRFVIVNGQRLREGGQLREGLALVAITPTGVVLDYRGSRFLLPRE